MLATLSKAAVLAAAVGLATADKQTVATTVAAGLHPEAAKAEHAHWLNTISSKKETTASTEFLQKDDKPHRHAPLNHRAHVAATKSSHKTVRATAVAPKAVTLAAPPKRASKAAAASGDDVLDADDDSLDAPPAAATPPAAAEDDEDSVVAQLSSETEEVKESKANIEELESALKADIALLRESAKMQRVAKSHKRRGAAEKQVKRSEQLVKVTSAMVKESRNAAVTSAQRALRHTAAVRAAADELAAEARAELKSLGQATPGSSKEAPAASADDDEDAS